MANQRKRRLYSFVHVVEIAGDGYRLFVYDLYHTIQILEIWTAYYDGCSDSTDCFIDFSRNSLGIM